MILTNLLAISRISMITKEIYFEDVARQIIIDIEKNNEKSSSYRAWSINAHWK